MAWGKFIGYEAELEFIGWISSPPFSREPELSFTDANGSKVGFYWDRAIVQKEGSPTSVEYEWDGLAAFKILNVGVGGGHLFDAEKILKEFKNVTIYPQEQHGGRLPDRKTTEDYIKWTDMYIEEKKKRRITQIAFCQENNIAPRTFQNAWKVGYIARTGITARTIPG